MSNSATLSRLNTEMKSHHADADRPWLSLTSAAVNREDYVRQLVVTYGFEAPLEAAFAYTRGLGDVVAIRGRGRIGLLAQDLLALHVPPTRITELPQCFSITPFPDPAEAFGWMYVVERATLLHDSVRRHVLRRLPEARHACNYLSAYDGVVGARWSALGEALDQYAYARTEAVQKRIAVAADHAFRRWRDWIEMTHKMPLVIIDDVVAVGAELRLVLGPYRN